MKLAALVWLACLAIYLDLLWRARSRGTFVGPDVVRLETTADYDPDVEDWQFPPGSVVRCVAE